MRMRMRRCLITVMLLGLPLVPVSAQGVPLSVRSEVGVGLYSAQAPYEGGLAAVARLGVEFQVRASLALALDAHLLGSATSADFYVVNSRPLPNTVGASASLVSALGSHRQYRVDVGAGAYHVASRANAPGGRGSGVHVGATALFLQRTHVALTFGVRAMLLPSVSGSRVLCVPASLGIVVR